MERPLIRIDFMVRTEHELRLDVHQFVSSEESALQRFLDSLLDRLDKLSRNRTTGNSIFENEAFSRRRLDLQFDVAILTAATGLTLVHLFAGCTLRNGLAISDL